MITKMMGDQPSAPEEPWEAVLSDFLAWANETFPEATAASCVAHLRSEMEELAEAPEDPEELADAAMLIWHAAHHAGVDLTAAVRAKLVKNQGREWGPTNAEGFREHVRPAPEEGEGGEHDWITDPTSAYWNLRTCVCGMDAREHPTSICTRFDPDWESVRKQLLALADAPDPLREAVEDGEHHPSGFDVFMVMLGFDPGEEDEAWRAWEALEGRGRTDWHEIAARLRELLEEGEGDGPL